MTNEYMRWFAMAESEHAKPLWRQDMARLERERQRLTSSRAYTYRYLLVALMMPDPPLSRAGIQPELVTQQRDAACVAIGLELYRRRTGYWPASLEALVPDLIPAVPPDRFDGRPLRYRLIDGRPLVYSVGSDRDDDEGRPPAGAAGRYDLRLAGFVGREGESARDGDWVLWSSTPARLPEVDEDHRAEQEGEHSTGS
jgi:hypothetical protein